MWVRSRVHDKFDESADLGRTTNLSLFFIITAHGHRPQAANICKGTTERSRRRERDSELAGKGMSQSPRPPEVEGRKKILFLTVNREILPYGLNVHTLTRPFHFWKATTRTLCHQRQGATLDRQRLTFSSSVSKEQVNWINSSVLFFLCEDFFYER
jgi:hypothetical protein